MANGVDPDQTAPSGSALFDYAILSDTLVYEILGHLRGGWVVRRCPLSYVTGAPN